MKQALPSDSRWTILGPAGRDAGNRARVHCRCSCGVEKIVDSYSVRNGKSLSCGCYDKEVLIARNTTHGKRHTREYRIWANMVQRCTNPKHPDYHRYGGRAIVVDPQWVSLGGFAAFIAEMGPSPTTKHELERRDNNSGYFKWNCRWATRAEQVRNKRNNRWITFDGQTRMISEWAKVTGLNRAMITLRLDRYKWPIGKALTTPSRKH